MKSLPALRVARFAILTLASAAGAVPLSAVAAQPDSTTGQQMIDAFEGTFGVHTGQRRNHIKGTCAAGEFVGTRDAAALSRSALFSGKSIPVIARFSLGGGNPEMPDAAPAPRPDAARHRKGAHMAEDGGIALGGFENLNQTKEVADYILALESFDGLRELQELKRIARRRVKAGDVVLDVGCGFGLETLRLARIAGASGRVDGVDKSESFIQEARRRAASQALTIEFRTGDAEALPYASGAFDVVRAERVLIYLDEPEMALSEMRRVAKTGGSIAIIEPDFDTNTINIPDRSLTRRILDHECDTSVRHGWLVRDLKVMLSDLGFRDIRLATRMVVFTSDLAAGYFTKTGQSAAKAGVIGETELSAWSDAIAERHAAGRLFAAIGYYLFTAST